MKIKRMFKILLIGFGIILGLILLYLTIIIFFPIFSIEKQSVVRIKSPFRVPACRQNITFDVDGLALNGWLYLPQDTTDKDSTRKNATKQLKSVPCIVLNSGFCGTKDMILEKYALRFVKAGYAALTFDYRHFGDSEGKPRQLYSEPKQLEDIKAAIDYARSRKEIDPGKIVIWGTSSSGNFGMKIASEDRKILGVIGQTPSINSEADEQRIFKRDGIVWILKLLVHAQRDMGRSRFGLSAHTIPAVGKPKTTAVHIGPGIYEGYTQFAKYSGTFKNEVCARIIFEQEEESLQEAAKKINCPILLLLCENDNINSADSPEEIEAILGNKLKIVKYPIGHFDIYTGEYFEKTINEQILFIKNISKNYDTFIKNYNA